MMARARMLRRAETQKVQAGDRPRAHGEHIAQYAANARRRPLKRLDVRGVIVAFHLEDASLPIADVDDAGVFARPLNDPGRLGGKFSQMKPRGFVEQCSFHIAEKMPSSVNVGGRPMSARMRAYSSGLSPCAAAKSGVTLGSIGLTMRSVPKLAPSLRWGFLKRGGGQDQTKIARRDTSPVK